MEPDLQLLSSLELVFAPFLLGPRLVKTKCVRPTSVTRTTNTKEEEEPGSVANITGVIFVVCEHDYRGLPWTRWSVSG